MTPEERAAHALGDRIEAELDRVGLPPEGLPRNIYEWLEEFARAAVAAEREACATIAADKAEQYRGEPWERVPHAHTILLELAAAIRARQEPR